MISYDKTQNLEYENIENLNQYIIFFDFFQVTQELIKKMLIDIKEYLFYYNDFEDIYYNFFNELNYNLKNLCKEPKKDEELKKLILGKNLLWINDINNFDKLFQIKILLIEYKLILPDTRFEFFNTYYQKNFDNQPNKIEKIQYLLDLLEIFRSEQKNILVQKNYSKYINKYHNMYLFLEDNILAKEHANICYDFYDLE